jgi:hypothetical protein
MSSFAQELSSIEGLVIDTNTKEPIGYASVYLANTTIGVASGMDGTFKLDKIPIGKYDFIVSMLGYATYTKPIQFSGNHITNYKIELRMQPKQLEMVDVRASKLKENRAFMTIFKKYFLGETANSSSCLITNPQVIHVVSEKGIYTAEADRPIEIRNDALGYTITYTLKEFKLDMNKQLFFLSGVPRFIELTPKNEKEMKRWQRERDRAYYGSISHFFRALKKGEAEANYFSLSNSKGQVIKDVSLIRGDTVKHKGSLYVNFFAENAETRYQRQFGTQNSELQFKGKPIIVYDNGYYEDFHNVILLGYIGWSDRISELVPLNYQPSKPLK